MATALAVSTRSRAEARFSFVSACAMSAIIVGGFSLNIFLGRSSFHVPLIVHLHAVVMMGWIGIYLIQNTLIFTENVALHRRLGWVAIMWMPWVLVVGLLITRHSLQSYGGPPFFDQNQFLISNPLYLVCFFGLTLCAVRVRRNSAWHRRLLFCAFAMLIGPGLGRIVPTPLLIPYAWYLTELLPAVLLPVIGMVADKRIHGRIHPAWSVGIAAVVITQLVADIIAYSPIGYRFTEWFLAGSPGAERAVEAFFPAI